jgi:hypothetical protein
VDFRNGTRLNPCDKGSNVMTVRLDQVEYLLRRKAPGYRGAAGLRGQGDHNEARSQELERYHRSLLELSDEEVQRLADQERHAEAGEWHARAERMMFAEDRHVEGYEADYRHWGQLPLWSTEEAVSLCFGVEPGAADFAAGMPGLEYTDLGLQFADNHRKLRDLVGRAVQAGLIDDPVNPGEFLAWANRHHVAIPNRLAEIVDGQGMVIADCQGRYEKLLAEYADLARQHEEALEHHHELEGQCRTLRARIDDLEAVPRAEMEPNSPTYPPELDWALKAWTAAQGNRDEEMTAKQQIIDWLEPRGPQHNLSGEAIERIATVCNWNKRGGRRRHP